MPIYEFECQNCKSKFEKLTNSKDKNIICPVCESNKNKKLISKISTSNSSCGRKCSHNCKCG